MRLAPRFRPKQAKDTEHSLAYAAGMSLGSRIREARVAAGLTQTAVGNYLGKTKTAVSYWESDVAKPELDDRVDLARLLNIPFYELMPELMPEVEAREAEPVVLTDPSIRQIVRLWPSLKPELREVLLMAVVKLSLPEPSRAGNESPAEPLRLIAR